MRPVSAAFATTVTATAIAVPVTLPNPVLATAHCIGEAPPTVSIGVLAVMMAGTIIISAAVPTTSVIMVAALAMMFAIPFVTTSGPIAAVAVVHIVPPTTSIEDVEAIAGIPIILIPAAAIAYVVETTAIVAVIIAIEGAVRIAAIAVIIIAVAIVIITKADTGIIVAGRKPHGRRAQCSDPRGQFCTHSRHKTYPNMYPSALFPSWPIRRHGPS